MVRRSGAAVSGAGVAGLGWGFQGQVLLPDDSGYDQAWRVWNAMVDGWSAVIARCASSAEVAAAVGFARARGLEVGCAAAATACWACRCLRAA